MGVENKLKLGIFGVNLDGGLSATTVNRYKLSWESTKAVTIAADRAGFEVSVPVARWKGLTGSTNYNGTSYETLSWAAGLGPVTDRIVNFSTVHVTAIHPIVAAKQLTTIDHISGGRAGCNIVCGWYPAEFEMFGTAFLSHTDRYAYAAEWIDAVRLLWKSEEEFDFEGRFLQIKKGWAMPKPLQRPEPTIMQAGVSGVGRDFAAQYADLAFLPNVEPPMWEKDFDLMKANYADLRRVAYDNFGRKPEIWTSVGIICRPTRKEAEDYYRHCFYDNGDYDVIASIPDHMLPPAGAVSDERREQMKRNMLMGFGGLTLMGTPDEVADQLIELSNTGLDGVAMIFVDYETELPAFVKDVIPLLEQAGLRTAPKHSDANGPLLSAAG